MDQDHFTKPTIASNGSEFAHGSWIPFFYFFSIHQTLPGFSGIQLDSYSACLKNNTKRSHLENNLQDKSRCGKSAFLIHMSDSRLQIAPRRPKKIHRAWENTYICSHTLHLYFREDLQACWTTEWLLSILSHNVTPNSYSDSVYPRLRVWVIADRLISQCSGR